MSTVAKSIASIALAIVLVFGLAAPAFADESDGDAEEEMVLRHVFVGFYVSGSNTKFDCTGTDLSEPDIMHGYNEDGDLILLTDHLYKAPQWNESERKVVIDESDYDAGFIANSGLKLYSGNDGCDLEDPIHGNHIQCSLYVARMMPTSSDVGNGASTVIQLSTYTSHIHVTVPLSITMSLDMLGGHGYAPKNYTIRNRTSVPVCVSTAVAEPVSEGLFGVPKYGFGTPESTRKNGTAISNGKYGDIWAEFVPKDSEQSHKMMFLDADTSGKTQEVNWVIPAKPNTEGAEIEFYVYDEERYATDADGISACVEAIIANNPGLNDKKKARLRALAMAVNWEDLMRVTYEYYEDHDIDMRVIDSNDANEYTSFGFDVHADSSLLSYPEKISSGVANIMFTVGVARGGA